MAEISRWMATHLAFTKKFDFFISSEFFCLHSATGYLGLIEKEIS
jgi:hypothetical protein